MGHSGSQERAAEVAVGTAELRTALDEHGITLPSLGIEPVTYAGSEAPYPYPLVHLGNCNLTTARKLTEVLRAAKGAAQ